jgi:hypothetical protein
MGTSWFMARLRGLTFVDDTHAAKGVAQLDEIARVHFAAYIEEPYRERSAPTAKLRLAALKHLFDWMVTGQIMPTIRRPPRTGRATSDARRGGEDIGLMRHQKREAIKQRDVDRGTVALDCPKAQCERRDDFELKQCSLSLGIYGRLLRW